MLDILLIEDNEDDVEIVRRVLTRGLVSTQLRVAKDGQEALEHLCCGPNAQGPRGAHGALPDLVLLDLTLPKVDGLEILRRMKTDADLRAVPVVVLTGSGAERPIRECMELGSNMYLLKPIDIADVANIVSGVQKYWVRADGLERRQRTADDLRTRSGDVDA